MLNFKRVKLADSFTDKESDRFVYTVTLVVHAHRELTKQASSSNETMFVLCKWKRENR